MLCAVDCAHLPLGDTINHIPTRVIHFSDVCILLTLDSVEEVRAEGFVEVALDAVDDGADEGFGFTKASLGEEGRLDSKSMEKGTDILGWFGFEDVIPKVVEDCLDVWFAW
jgi:hypothetical protein